MTPEARQHRMILALAETRVAGEPVLTAMARVPREYFVLPHFQAHAFDNMALPIGQGQTISQPEIVAMMTQALDVQPHHRVLEIGTGSGYQTAILALLCDQIFTIERHEPLLTQAQERLAGLGFSHIHYHQGDGSLGWPEAAPFDCILVAAAAEDEPPQPLLDQLAVGGVMVLPISHDPLDQRLVKIRRIGETDYVSEAMGAARFVPLVSDHHAPSGPLPVAKALTRLRRRR